MDQTQTNKKTPGKGGLGWRVLPGLMAALVCGAVLWGRFSGVEDAQAISSTLVAAVVLALSLVLALTSKPR